MQAASQLNTTSLIHALVRHYDGLVESLRRQYWRSPHSCGLSAEDIAREAVHEVCLQLLREEPGLSDVRIPLAFLRTLTQRRAIDVLRREHTWRKPLVPADDTEQYLTIAAAASAQPEARLQATQQLQQLACAIEALPPRCRDAFELCRIHGWSQQAAADHLAMSVRTVERHVRVALACCRIAMADVWGTV
ncbi:RNA polymerase sigma factor [Lampropedia puyangensis]|uniref:RNA polymerase sigma factor n=1 Tax=Lampropedia puyangensis TaxID=1330072 RepID=A0A4S8FEH8_9BURK|nr:RNA polymerase sigma factor [Lampropedia puyangensis]THU05084.1 RNA polymerase sigma factor [Lampropedia puyangensis]